MPSDTPRQVFWSRIIWGIVDTSGYWKCRTTPYHPQADGLTERFNRTLEGMLRCFIEENLSEWDEYLDPLAFAYNTAVHATARVQRFEKSSNWPDLFNPCAVYRHNSRACPDSSVQLRRLVANSSSRRDHSHDRGRRNRRYLPSAIATRASTNRRATLWVRIELV